MGITQVNLNVSGTVPVTQWLFMMSKNIATAGNEFELSRHALGRRSPTALVSPHTQLGG